MFPHRLIASAIALTLVASACGGSDEDAVDEQTAGGQEVAVETSTTIATTEPASGDGASNDAATFFPDVLDATATQADDGTWTFAVTLSSPYDTPEHYADAWRVVGPDGDELGFRLLTHDHANEQPFTRSHSGIESPSDVTTVTIEGRDLVNGWGGDFLEFELPA